MVNAPFTSYRIEERSYVAFVKREIHNLVRAYFDVTRVGEIDIVISEMTSNLIKYAGNGELLYRLAVEKDEPFFEAICIDNGPGMKNVGHSVRDGVSSTSSLGQGMGSIIRLSSFAQIYSLPDWGTIVYASFFNEEKNGEKREDLLIGCLNVSKPEESVSGDGFAAKIHDRKTGIFVGDGLGHGKAAKEAADEAIRVFHESSEQDPATLIREINAAVRKTRGLVATAVVYDPVLNQWSMCGVGNISTRLYQGLEYKNYICHNGIVGMNIPTRLESTHVQASRYQHLILCSDGIRSRWDLVQYPSILKYAPMIIASAIYKDHARKTDDMTILIAKVL